MSLPITIYTPESPLKNPGWLFASRELAWWLFVCVMSARHRQSMLGSWAFISPPVASLPFVFVNSQGMITIKETSILYAAYAIIGTIIWQVLSDSLPPPEPRGDA
jgi:homopolymeric O-antigen transport system permease protein